MKQVLYGTTALVAVGLVAGEASATSGLKLGRRADNSCFSAKSAVIGGDADAHGSTFPPGVIAGSLPPLPIPPSRDGGLHRDNGY